MLIFTNKNGTPQAINPDLVVTVTQNNTDDNWTVLWMNSTRKEVDTIDVPYPFRAVVSGLRMAKMMGKDDVELVKKLNGDINYEFTDILVDDTTRGIFEAVLQPRTILIRDLKSKFPGTNVTQSITLLKNAKLIKEQAAPIYDFSTLYVTADGLNMAESLKFPTT